MLPVPCLLWSLFLILRDASSHMVRHFAQLAFIMRLQSTYAVLFKMLCEFSALGLGSRLSSNGSSSEQTIIRQKTAEGKEAQSSPLPRSVSVTCQSVPQLWLGSNQDPRPFKAVCSCHLSFQKSHGTQKSPHQAKQLQKQRHQCHRNCWKPRDGGVVGSFWLLFQK